MNTEFEELIVKLHECLLSPQSGDVARSIISDIIYMCGENLNNQSTSLCISLFFKREKNLLTFLKKAIREDSLKACKVDLLQFLARFLSSTGKQAVECTPDIKDTCILIFNSEKYSDVRCSTFPVISKCLEIANGNHDVVAKMNLDKLVNDYFVSLLSQSKITSSLKANVLSMLGFMCRHHPEVMITYSNKCLDLFLNNLKTEMSKKEKHDFNVIAGSLEGLNYYLYNFTHSAEEGSEHAKNIFEFTKQALMSTVTDLTRYAVPKAALELLAKHAEQFDEFIYADYKDLFERISQWAQHKNYEMKKLGYLALDSYYKQLAEILKKKAKSEKEKEKCREVFIYFMKKFYRSLTADSDLKETVVAIKGFGAFAGPCREFVDKREVRTMFTLIIDICERTYFSQAQQQQQQEQDVMPGYHPTEIFDEKIYQLPSFIESLACVCGQLEEPFPEGSVTTLERIVCLSIDSYNKLAKRYNYLLSLAIVRLFLAFQMGRFSFYSEFVSRVVYQSMVRTFSYRTKYSLQQEQGLAEPTFGAAAFQEEFGTDASQQREADTRIRNFMNTTSTDFVQLWSNLLNLNDFKELNTIGVHVNERKHLVRVIYDELIESFLKIMKKLDLNAVKIEHGDETENEQQQQQHQQQSNTSIDISVSSNPIAGLRPSRPKDLEVLINLVDFSRELLIQKHYDLFERWLFRFSKEIILLSSKYFLLSGFYKLNTLCMRIAIRLEYFKRINDELKNNKSFNESIEEEEENTNEETMNKTNLNNLSTFEKEIDLNLQYDKLNCFFLYKKFIKEIYVRMKQFKDELLASCLEFMLSLPKELIVLNLKEAFEALQASLEIGINYLPMADNALTSLEYWLHNIPLARLKPFYPAILAKFDDYLQMRNLNSNTDELATQEKVLLLKVNTKNSRKKGLMPKESKGSSFEKGNSSSYGEQIGSVVYVVDELYEQIQLRILKILGQLAGDMSHCLYDENDVNASKQLIAWDTNLHLKFYVPFTDMKPVIYFDRFLPRVIYLALSSTNRQTKIIACELLHAIVIYTIGKSVSDPESGGAQFRLTKIYHIIYPALFKLACDVDHFARNLFQPLVMQMIHWFTGNKKYESADTVELLNCIMDCLVDEKDAALRDFSSSTLREFLKWSIKHTPVAKQDAVSQHQQSPVNVKSILKRIFNFLTHPSSSKRLGALRAWNSIYTIFREEEILVNKFIFELLYHLVQSLALAEKDDKMLGTQEQCKLALDHVERIIRVKAEILNERSADRVKPLGWAEAVLEVAIRWLMRQCGRIETECRHKSMELVHKLTPCINGVKDTREYFQLKLKHDGVGYFIGRFEGSVQKNLLFRDSLANFKTLPELGSGDGDDSTYQLSFVLTWLGMLVAPLDCYTWIFGERLMQPSVLFGDAATPNAPNPQKTCIWTSLSYFFDNVVNLDLTDLIKRIYAKNNDKALVVCTPHEIEEYKRTKCTALVRTFDFLITLLSWQSNESMRLIPSHIWSEQLFTCLIRTCLDPARMGFSLSDLDVLTNLPIKSRQVLKLLSQNLHPNVVARLKQLCVVLIDERREFKSLHDYIELIKTRSGDNDDGDDVMMNQSEMIGQIDWLKLSQLVNGYEQLSELDLYHFPDDLNRVLFEYILNKEEVDDQQESQTCAEAKRKLLNLTLSLNSFSTKSSQSSDYLIQIVDKYLFSSTNETEKTSKTPKTTNMNRFLQYYKNEIFQWMCKRHESLLTYVLSKLSLEFVKSVSLLTHLIEYVGTEKVLRKTCGTKLVAYLYDHWHAFKEFWQNATAENGVDRKLALINLLTKSLLIESFQSQSANKEQSFKNIAEMYMSFLVDKQLKLAQKIKLLDLLFFFTESPAPFTLKLYLPQLVAQLPLKSSELVRGDPAFNDYTSSIRKILVALEFTGSLDILSLVVSIICREKQHLLESEVQLTFVKLMHRSNLEKQASLITSYWEQAFKNAASAAQDEERRLALFNKLVYEFLKSCAKPVFIDFMCANAIYLFELLDVPFRDVNFENTCSNRTCALRIFELAYKRLHKDEIFCPTAKLCNTYETKKIGQVKDGKELTKEVLRKCRKNLIEEYKFTSTNIPQSRLDSCDELLRQLHCSAYNCLTSLFIRTQSEPKLYLACLFKEDAAQGEFIFEPLIDKKREYTFPIEMTDTSSYTQRKTKLISLRDEFRRDEADQTSSTQANYISTIHSTNSLAATYLNTQNLYESSLSEELGVFDFMNAGSNSFRPSLTSSGSFTSGNSSLSEQQQQLELKRKYVNYFRNRRLSGGGSNSDLTSMNSAGGASDLESTPIELELDDLNQHECMVAFVELLQSLVVNKITPVYDRGQTPSDMPPWMSYLHRKCVDVVYTHDNVKLFILRAILNTPHIFKPYAKFWLAPMIGFLVNCSSLTKLDYIDAFTLDLMVLMLSWHSVAVPQASEKKIVNRLFESLIRRCYHETRAILKNNLELLKTMTELWRELIEVPVGMIYDYLSAPSTDQRKLITGIQLFGIVLTNQIDVYDYPTNVSSLDFYRSLISCMRNTSKSMHAPSAEVVGLLLRWLQKKQKLLENSEAAKKAEQEKFDRVLEDLFQVLSRLELNLFITCVHRIQLNYPPISERCMTKLIHNLPKLYGEYKLMCAESILSSIHTLQDPFFKLNAFMNMLTHRESALQLVCLKMLNAVIDKQPEEEIARMLPIICSFVNHSNIACRYQMLVALISIYDIYAGAAQSTTTANIKKQTQETLLRALLDPEPTIRVIAHNFWTEKANMPSSTIDRMCMILDKMYSPQIESEYLSYATNLLLEKTSKSPDYNRLIFESPLNECAFREYNLSADWKVRHEIMTPLFVDTLSSLNAATSSLDPNGSNISSNFLRATQQNSLAQFQPTQDALAMSNARNKPVVTNAYNWLTQSSMDTLQASLISGFSLGETQSSLLFSAAPSSASRKSSSIANPNEAQDTDPDRDIYRLKKRFLKDISPNVQSRFFSRKNMEKKDKEEEARKQMRMNKMSRVEKYRKYRIGDFPDIQIKFSEIIAPVQALAQKDSQVAMVLFESLFVSILSEVSDLKDTNEARSILKSIESNFNHIFTTSDSYNPNLIACAVEIALKHATSFRLEASSISMACMNSLQQSFGVVLIEEYLALDANQKHQKISSKSDDEEDAPVRKRIRLSDENVEEKRGSNDDEDETRILWIELAKLYRSMNDYDSIKGIFANKKNIVTDFTKNGFEFESNNDYQQARKCYSEAMSTFSSNNNKKSESTTINPTRTEKDLWEESYLRCCNELTDWKSMCEHSTRSSTVSLRQLFSDFSSPDSVLFPYAFKSKLKIILQEDIAEQRRHEDLIKFMAELDSDNKKSLEQSFALEMAIINLHQKDLSAAKYYANMAIERFLVEWASINKTILQSRITKLQSLQAVIELNEFLKFVEINPTFSVETTNHRVNGLVELWTSSMPNLYSDPPATWDDVITNRCIYLEYIEDKYYSNLRNEDFETSSIYFANREENDMSRQKVLNKIKKSRSWMRIKFAEAAHLQGNYKLALTKLQQTRQVLKAHHLIDLRFTWINCYLNTHLSRSKRANAPDERLNTFFSTNVLKEILKYDDSASELDPRCELYQDHCILHANFARFLIDSLFNATRASPNYYDEKIVADSKKSGQLIEYVKADDISDFDETVDKLMKHGLKNLLDTKHELKGSLELSSYCDYFLRLIENDELEKKIESKT